MAVLCKKIDEKIDLLLKKLIKELKTSNRLGLNLSGSFIEKKLIKKSIYFKKIIHALKIKL